MTDLVDFYATSATLAPMLLLTTVVANRRLYSRWNKRQRSWMAAFLVVPGVVTMAGALFALMFGACWDAVVRRRATRRQDWFC